MDYNIFRNGKFRLVSAWIWSSSSFGHALLGCHMVPLTKKGYSNDNFPWYFRVEASKQAITTCKVCYFSVELAQCFGVNNVISFMALYGKTSAGALQKQRTQWITGFLFLLSTKVKFWPPIHQKYLPVKTYSLLQKTTNKYQTFQSFGDVKDILNLHQDVRLLTLPRNLG